MNTLHRLVEEERLEAVKYLLEKTDVDLYCYGAGEYPLIIAVERNNVPIARALLEKLSSEDSKQYRHRDSDICCRPLNLAVIKNSIGMVRLLLSHGAYFERVNSTNRLPLDLAVVGPVRDLLSSIKQLFQLTNAKDVSCRDSLNSISAENAAAIMYARNSHSLTVMQGFMNSYNLTALDEITSFRMDKLERADCKALDAVDNLYQYFERVNLNLKIIEDLSGNDAPMPSAIKSQVVSILLPAFEFLNACTPLVNRIIHNQPLLTIIAECIIFYGKDTSKFTENVRLKKLIDENRPGRVAQLLNLCVLRPMRLFIQSVCTAKMLRAAEANDLATLEACLVGNPKLRQCDASGLTPLHHALRHGNNQMAELLLIFGAADGDGDEECTETLLHCAMRHMDCTQGVMENKKPQVSTDVVRMILDSRVGDDYVNARRLADGFTALHLAVRANNFCNVQLLLSRGAAYCFEDEAEQRPADLCTQEGHKICELLDWCKRLFQMARNGKVDDLLETVKALDKFTVLAVGGARNNLNNTLVETLEHKGHAEVAEKMRLLLSDARAE